MAKPHQRAFALTFALIFLGTVVVSGGAVVWQIIKDNEQSTTQKEAVDALEQEGALQGTKLADFTPATQVDKLEIIDLIPGDGEEAAAGATVTAHYTGAVAKTGIIFESSHDGGEPATFPLGDVIKGWQEGVPGMKVGGKRRLIIPAALAYGEAGSPPAIGPNEPLVFDIELTALPKE